MVACFDYMSGFYGVFENKELAFNKIKNEIYPDLIYSNFNTFESEDECISIDILECEINKLNNN